MRLAFIFSKRKHFCFFFQQQAGRSSVTAFKICFNISDYFYFYRIILFDIKIKLLYYFVVNSRRSSKWQYQKIKFLNQKQIQDMPTGNSKRPVSLNVLNVTSLSKVIRYAPSAVTIKAFWLKSRTRKLNKFFEVGFPT